MIFSFRSNTLLTCNLSNTENILLQKKSENNEIIEAEEANVFLQGSLYVFVHMYDNWTIGQ